MSIMAMTKNARNPLHPWNFKMNQSTNTDYLLSIAPMLDWTDRHCRYLHRLLSKRVRLYSEMVTTGAILFGDKNRHLDFDAQEYPLALQLGGSDYQDLAQCAKIGQQWGYAEINLNCGCPSDRVQRGAFGACLMREPGTVAQCVQAMRDAVDIPITVKHRIGLDENESYDFVRDFVGTVYEAGCRVFIIHARNAWLQGLSPKENREIPPLRYAVAHQLKRDFPDCTMIINGGIQNNAQIAEHLSLLDGVMVGRAAYHNPWWLHTWDADFYGENPRTLSREDIESQMVEYMQQQLKLNQTGWYAIARHMLGLRNGLPGARRWRQVWSDHRLKNKNPAEVFAIARATYSGGDNYGNE